MKYIDIFIAFFIPGVVGYGGGPASIPLIQAEVVDRYKWLTIDEFGEILALANGLPGPIVTKMAGYIGYEVGGVFGSIIALFSSVAPSLIAMLVLLGLITKFKNSPVVKKLTNYIKPTIAILLGALTLQFFLQSLEGAGLFHTVILLIVSWICLEKFRVHPSLIIIGTLFYGLIFIS
ncbi:Chromate transport protein [Jeotgalicoccus saudimassiliensis]|uniref:Chromate transport protein n=1 Tax=Jeotgalicoccus saudimassiliensis TaxID=1461582 RepID=A0A078M9K8_9STAP|nr:chromate transporter [Jeotgalicoccus saudimassiliensis]CEA02995.1 Chromate transport protein [Jeotgalicoccus saudimassiliensis]